MKHKFYCVENDQMPHIIEVLNSDEDIIAKFIVFSDLNIFGSKKKIERINAFAMKNPKRSFLKRLLNTFTK